MPQYAYYDLTDGRIISLEKVDDPDLIANIEGSNELYIKIDDGVDVSGLSERSYVVNGQLVQRPNINLQIKSSYDTASSDLADISAVAGGKASVDEGVSGTPGATSVLIDDVEPETLLNFNRPGVYRLHVNKFPYKEEEYLISAHD